MVEHNQSANNPTNGGYNNAYKFNGKELDDATGMYYYGARYYDPRISIFVSVDPLAEKYPGWTPYHYVHNNPINMVDPTGMEAEGWRRNLANGEMSYDDSYTFENTDSNLYEYSDGGMDYKYYYNSDGTKTMTDDYMYDIAFGPSKPKSQPISTLSRGHGNADISKLQGNVVDALKYDLPEGLQNAGDALQVGGWIMMGTGVGAKPGLIVAGIGNYMSLAGGGLEALVLYSDGKKTEAYTKMATTGAFAGLGSLAVKGTRVVAGDEFVKKGLNSTSEAVIQGINMGMEKAVGKGVEDNKKKK